MANRGLFSGPDPGMYYEVILDGKKLDLDSIFIEYDQQEKKHYVVIKTVKAKVEKIITMEAFEKENQ